MQVNAPALAQASRQTEKEPASSQALGETASARQQTVDGSSRMLQAKAITERIDRSSRQALQLQRQARLGGATPVVQFDGFSGTVAEADDAVTYDTEGSENIAANMKRVTRVTGPSGKKYIAARGLAGAPKERLVNEAAHLETLRAGGLAVPNVYRNSETPAENTSGVISKEGRESFILMDYIDGKFVDMWKGEDKLRPGIVEYFGAVAAEDKAARVGALSSSLTRIKTYLDTHIVVDLQLIIEQGSGRAVIIDPAAIYPVSNEEKLEQHGENHERVKTELAAGLEQLAALLAPPAAERRGPPNTKQELERIWEEDCDGDDDAFKAKIKQMLSEAGMDDDDEAVKVYLDISEVM